MSRTPFTPLEYLAIAATILIWGVNNAASKIATEALPPLFVGGARFAMALVLLAPFVRPPFPAPRRLALIMLLSGPVHFAAVYGGFALVENLTPFVVSLQLWIPFTAVFAWLLLKETMPAAAIAGLAIAFVGVAWMSLDGHMAADLDGILVGLLASASWALATVLVRRTPAVGPLKMQGLTAFLAAPVLMGLSFAVEPGAVESARVAGPLVWASLAWAGLLSTLGATALLFWLVQRREPGRVTPYLLLTPLVSGVIGVAFMGDPLSIQLAGGAAATLAGVALVALTERKPQARAEAKLATPT